MTRTLDDVISVLDEIKTILRTPDGRVSARQVVVVNGLSDISERLGLVMAGEFRSGNSQEPGHGFTGVRIGYPAFTYESLDWNIVGVNNDTLQVGINALDGKLYAGAGVVVLNSGGIEIVANTTSAFLDDHAYKFVDASGNVMGGIWGVVLANTNHILVSATSAADLKYYSVATMSAVSTNPGSATVQLSVDNSGLTDNGILRLVQDTVNTRLELDFIQYVRFQATTVNPAYEDGYLKLYFYSDGAGVDEFRVRGKVGATETQVTLANITP